MTRFDADGPVADYTQVPAGSYRCRIGEVRTSTTRAGDERWAVRLVVVDGPHAGKSAAWDALVFSVRGRARARLVLAALGLPSSGRVQVEPTDLAERVAVVDVQPVQYTAADGTTVRRNEVPYGGWHAAAAGGGR